MEPPARPSDRAGEGAVVVTIWIFWAFPSARGQDLAPGQRLVDPDLDPSRRLADATVHPALEVRRPEPPDFGTLDQDGVGHFWCRFKGVEPPLLCSRIPVRCVSDILDRPEDIAAYADRLMRQEPGPLGRRFGNKTNDAVCTCELEREAWERLPANRFTRVNAHASRWLQGCSEQAGADADGVALWAVVPSEAVSGRRRGDRLDAMSVAAFHGRLHLHRAVQHLLDLTMLEFAGNSTVSGRRQYRLRSDMIEVGRQFLLANLRLGRHGMLRHHDHEEAIVEDMIQRMGHDEGVEERCARLRDLLRISGLSASEAIRRSSFWTLCALVVVNAFAVFGSWASVLQVLERESTPPIMGNARWPGMLAGVALGAALAAATVAVVWGWNRAWDLFRPVRGLGEFEEE